MLDLLSLGREQLRHQGLRAQKTAHEWSSAVTAEKIAAVVRTTLRRSGQSGHALPGLASRS
jgi:hypothetical protein